MPSETVAARLIAETLGSRTLNEYPESPRHDQLLRRALRRRRVTLKSVGENSQVFVFGGVVVGGMDAAVTTLVSAHARRITADPNLLRRHLQIQEVPLATEESPAMPAEAGHEPEQRTSVEPAAPSTIRAFVVGERVCASLLRLPPAEQAPAPDEAGQPQDSAEIAAGGLSIDVTAVLADALHELAVEAVMAVPGLFAAAVDLEVPDLESAESAVVRSVLPDADISEAHLPAYGEPRDVAGAIADEILLRASR
ncbi:hypothetical protein [Nesterenkonia sp. CF4.4]|uniref:hypothetical protein n=1 Tax=Nesterenkonia sp. CF4.4 TaxID=3373079 RepID=UPI003EE4433D